MSKIGVGVITCDRMDMYHVCIESIKEAWCDELVTVDDGKNEYVLAPKGEYIKTEGGEGVGKAKNKALKHLMDKGCDYIILVEDDMRFSGNLFAEYVKAYKTTGIQHFMFAYHGPANKAGVSYGKPVPRKVVDYGDLKIALNQHCVGAVTFYTKESLDKVGLYDEVYTNAFEHVDHSYMLAKSNYSTPYWWWADIANSLDFVQEQKCSEDSSAIRPRSDWNSNIRDAFGLFIKKHGISPVQVPDTQVKEVVEKLKQIYNDRS
jgi:glycosyltransferase involved in cell wall biosynthesis